MVMQTDAGLLFRGLFTAGFPLSQIPVGNEYCEEAPDKL